MGLASFEIYSLKLREKWFSRRGCENKEWMPDSQNSQWAVYGWLTPVILATQEAEIRRIII
jgi:hypothetical protein